MRWERLKQGKSKRPDYNWYFVSTCEVCVNSIAAVDWAWSGGKGVEENILDEEMLHNSLQRKGWNQR